MWLLGSGYGNNPSELMETTYYPVNFSLCYQNCILRIISTDTFNANEGVSVDYNLVTNDKATLSLIENTSNLFSLTGSTLTFNGIAADFESNTKSYNQEATFHHYLLNTIYCHYPYQGALLQAFPKQWKSH
jgi:hypothetical protein